MITVCVTTFNLDAFDRRDLFDRTWESLQAPGVTVIPVDNGSTDGTQQLVTDLGGYCYTGPNTTCGHGTNLAARVAIGTDADLCVLSDDDMEWHPGWHERLAAWWHDAPDDLWLTGCHLEPAFPWNQIHGRLDLGGIPGLLRQSTGAASWSFRPARWPFIGPIPQKIQGHGDVPACDRIWAAGGHIAQLDLATHLGLSRSSWGNRTHDLYGWDLDPVRRALEAP